jgi:hypothetical protein
MRSSPANSLRCTPAPASVCYPYRDSLSLLPVLLVAVLGQPSAPEISCRYSVRAPQRVTRAVQGGASVTVRRKADPALTDDACVIEVRDRSGRLVLIRDGFNTRLHDDSGRDVDNDGSPDLVIGSDSRRSNRCCSEYTILSLKPEPRVVGTFSHPSFEVDLNRRTLVWSVLAFEDLGAAMGPVPTIATVGQYRDGRFVDLTPEYCSVILAGTAPGSSNLSEDLWQLDGSRRAASRAEADPPSFGVETTRGAATTVALQMLYCGRDSDARELIRQVWPDRQQEAIRASLVAATAAARRR